MTFLLLPFYSYFPSEACGLLNLIWKLSNRLSIHQKKLQANTVIVAHIQLKCSTTYFHFRISTARYETSNHPSGLLTQFMSGEPEPSLSRESALRFPFNIT